jgi:DNA repair photolyase
MIPALTDHEMEAIIAAAVRRGARTGGYIPLRMPHEIKDLFREWLATHAPDRKARVLRYIRETHGGRDYDPAWGKRMRGSGPYAALMAARFEVVAKKMALERLAPQRRDLFRRPPRAGDQLSFFDRQ